MTDSSCLMKDAKNSLPSEYMKAYLDSEEYRTCFVANRDKGWNSYPTWSCMQLLTIADYYMTGRKKVRFIRRIAEETDCSPNKKALLRMYARDFAGNKYRGKISLQTHEFYESHIHVYEKYGAGPFEELLFLPVIFKPGDVVSHRYKRERLHYYIVLACPDYNLNLFFDHSDESYTVIDLDAGKKLLDEEEYYYWHNHFNPEVLELVPDRFIPEQYQVPVKEFRKIHDLENKNYEVSFIPGLFTKEEMRIRTYRRVICEKM